MTGKRLKNLTLTLMAAMMVIWSGAADAGNQANQTVNFEVKAINELSVSGSPGSLAVEVATAGSEPTDDTEESTTFNLTTNGSSKKVTAVIASAMPSGVTLKIKLDTSPDVTLTDTAADVLTGLTKTTLSGKTVKYTLSATVAAGVVAADSRVVTLTLQ
ncbi:MAG: hypothetical protein HY815_03960 [Candidatus Riflebacteria bacterium]|nr:hypothetical protein [Candidatus Riflebacteria bacterium]